MNGTSRAELRRLVELTVTLAVTDFRMRFYGNALGYFWSLAKPLMLFAVIYIAFTEVLNIGDAVPYYPAVLISGLVLFNFFSEATGSATTSLVATGHLLRKMPVPSVAIPLSVVLRSFFNLVLNLIAVAVFFAIAGVEFHTSWIQFPLIIGGLVVFAVAVSSVLASLYVPLRDTAQIWEVGLQLMFWSTPIIYPVERIPSALQEIVMLNPLAVLIVQMRHAMIDPAAPSAAEVAGWGHVWIALAIGAATLPIGVLLYRRVAPRLAEQL